MVSQKHVERETEAALGKPACAAMAGRTTVGEESGGRFALIEILGACSAPNHNDCAKGEETAPHPLQQPQLRCYTSASIFLCHKITLKQ